MHQLWDLVLSITDVSENTNERCEAIYKEQHIRLADGTFVAPTPFKDEHQPLGNSYRGVLRFFLGQEKRWPSNATHYALSNESMQEYINMNHMTPITIEEQRNELGYVFYLPYLSILRSDA